MRLPLAGHDSALPAASRHGQFCAVRHNGRVNETSDRYRLERFVAAQDGGGSYEQAVAELRAGAKVSHWMWFVFPQIAGLGLSALSRRFAISSLAEARAYLAHPVLGPRLRECARIVAGTEGKTAERIFGPVDAMKLRSSMTLFAAAAGEDDQAVFRAVLAKYFDGETDEATVSRLLASGHHARQRRRPGQRVPAVQAPAINPLYRDGRVKV